jgi:hypothetical protein
VLPVVDGAVTTGGLVAALTPTLGIDGVASWVGGSGTTTGVGRDVAGGGAGTGAATRGGEILGTNPRELVGTVLGKNPTTRPRKTAPIASG